VDDAAANDVPPTTLLLSAQSPGLGDLRDRAERPLLAGRYEILALVGAGGMGTVYRARDHELDDVVALKVIRPELMATPGILDRFRREAKLARRVTHHNVARVFDIGEHQGEKFLSMEFIEGESLAAALARDGALSLGRAVAVGTAVAEGLGSAHAAGVVHRDLKPDNVLLGRDGRVVVTDFGIARALVEARGASSSTGMLLGTPAYMAPEQVEARADVDARADIYAFGALLYELFTGHRAWPGESSYAVASARLLAPPPDPRLRRPDLPAACAEIILHCMARAPEDRPASIGEAAAALRQACSYPSDAPTLPFVRAVSTTISSSRPGSTGAGGPVEKTVAVLPFRNAGAPDETTSPKS
jgi:serine/threonine-protein kinase